MALTKFCSCCDLRRGCVVFAWIQMMYLVMTIVILIGYAETFSIISYSYTHKSSQYYPAIEIATSMVILGDIITGFLFIKVVTCISLLWGVVKQNHLFYQPWLVISGIDVGVSSLLVLVFFILGCTLSALFFLLFFIYGVLTGLNGYFWACVYTVYKKDMKPSTLCFEMGYSSYTNPVTEM